MARVAVVNRFGYAQTVASSTWIVDHNLGVNSPVVDVWETDGTEFVQIVPDSISYTSPNSVTINFSTAKTGQVLVT